MAIPKKCTGQVFDPMKARAVKCGRTLVVKDDGTAKCECGAQYGPVPK